MDETWHYWHAVKSNVAFLLEEFSTPCQIHALAHVMMSKDHLTMAELRYVTQTTYSRDAHEKLLLYLLDKKSEFKVIYFDLVTELEKDDRRLDIPKRINDTLKEMKKLQSEPTQETFKVIHDVEVPHDIMANISSLCNFLGQFKNIKVGQTTRTEIPSEHVVETGQMAEDPTALLTACAMGNETKVEQLLNDPNIVNTINSAKTALHVVCDGNNVDVLSKLLRCDSIDVNAKDENGLTVFVYICRRGNSAMLNELLKNDKVNCNVADRHGIKAVWYLFVPQFIHVLLDYKQIHQHNVMGNVHIVRDIARNLRKILLDSDMRNHNKIVMMLLEDGRINVIDLLSVAILLVNSDIVSTILDHVHLDTIIESYYTLLISCVLSNDYTIMCRFLNDTEAQFNQLDKNQMVYIFKLCISINNHKNTKLLINRNKHIVIPEVICVIIDAQFQKENKLNVFENFIAANFDFKVKDENGNTAFALACMYANKGLIATLLPLADTKSVNNAGQSAFMLSCFNYDKEVPKLLAESGMFDLKTKDKYGKTGFVYARQVQITELLGSVRSKYLGDAKVTSYETLLLEACKVDQVDEVTELITQTNVDVNTKDSSNYTPLMHACANGCRKVVTKLIEVHADTNSTNCHGTTALMVASGCGQYDVVSMLLTDTLVEVNQKDIDGVTALMHTCLRNDTETASRLISDDRINLNIADNFGNSALLYSCDLGPEIVPILLNEEKVLVNQANCNGQTALIKSSINSCTNVLHEILKRKDIDINAIDNTGSTALILAIKNGNIEAANSLLEHKKVEINISDNQQRTALIWACIEGHELTVSHLLKHNELKVNCTDMNNDTALLMSCLIGRNNIVVRLLERDDTDVNLSDRNKDNALLLACRLRHKNIVSSLLAHEATDVNVTKYGDTPLLYAYKNGSTDILFMLLGHERIDVNVKDSYSDSVFIMACRDNNTKVISTLLGLSGTDVNAYGKDGHTALNTACMRSQTELVSLLLRKPSINVNLKSISMGYLPLLIAYKKGDTEILNLLLGHPNINVNLTNDDGITILDEACKTGDNDMVSILLAMAGTKVNVSGALSEACNKGHIDIVSRLLKCDSIDVNFKSTRGDTALTEACRNGHYTVVCSLLEFKKIDIEKSQGKKALRLAKEMGHTDIEQLLRRRMNACNQQ